jgi:hypothetical protein
MYGPFHRLESPTQTTAVASQQVASGEIWGAPARGSNIPSVKAYRNSLPQANEVLNSLHRCFHIRGAGRRMKLGGIIPKPQEYYEEQSME